MFPLTCEPGNHMSTHHDLKTLFPATVLGLCFLSMLFSGCDNTPNPNFEQEIQNKQSASEDDVYSALENAPRLQIYAWWEANQRQALARVEAERFGKIYEDTLTKLDTETTDKNMRGLLVSCRDAFAGAVAYQKRKVSAGPGNTASDGQVIFNELRQCRDGAVKAGEADDEKTSQQSVVLRRFASAGMALVGVSAIAHGNESAGVEMWRQGDELLVEDKPGFKLTLKALRGY